MKFTDIGAEASVFPGEYILHVPTSALVMAGAFNRDKDMIRAFKDGKLFEDVIANFQKIELDKRIQHYKDRKCGKCKGGIR